MPVIGFEAWWSSWWEDNAIVADNTEEVCKANAKQAYDAGKAERLSDVAIHAHRLEAWINDDKASIMVAGSILGDLLTALGEDR